MIRPLDPQAVARLGLTTAVTGLCSQGWLGRQRWFGGKSRSVTQLRLRDQAAFALGDRQVWWGLLAVAYADGGEEAYLLWFGLAETPPPGCVPLVRWDAAAGRPCCLYDLADDADAVRAVLALVRSAQPLPAVLGRFTGEVLLPLPDDLAALPVHPCGGEQSNSNFRLGDRCLGKLFRRFLAGPQPDYEILAHLTRRTRFRHCPALLAALHYHPPSGPPAVLALLEQWIAHRGDAWQQTVHAFRQQLQHPQHSAALPDFALLGRRTAQLHLALADAGDDPAFAPEPFLPADLDQLTQRIVHHWQEVRRHLPDPAGAGELAPVLDRVLRLGPRLAHRLADAPAALFPGAPPTGLAAAPCDKIRVHGDFHLGQVLCTGDGDFAIVDFEGEPGQPLELRRARHAALKDVAGMLRSFSYAAHIAARELPAPATGHDAARALYRPAAAAFLQGYRRTVDQTRLLPRDPRQADRLLELYLLDKALYEVLYELDHRPDWLAIPLAGLAELLAADAD
jgi:trehalose synthase-fused probable maltokinase